MARAATTTDAFNAVAEPRRRQILDVLAGGERSVNELVEALGIAQPQVSKHLRVLLEVGLVAVREEGRRRMYRLEARPLESIHEWVKGYERMWNARFDRLDQVLEEMAKEENDGSPRRAAKEENDGSPRRAAKEENDGSPRRAAGNEKEEGHGGSNQ